MKKQVATFFSRAGSTYARSAGVQAVVARDCAGRVPEQSYGLVVEIGAGGGVLTRVLRDRIGARCYVAVDIASGMLGAVASEAGVCPVVADGESMPLCDGAADLLVSSSTMQWYDAPERSLPRNLALLKDGGTFSVSLFVAGTLTELAQSSAATGFGSVYALPEAERFLSVLENVPGITYQHVVSDYVWEYPSPREFLRNLKQTGVNYTQSKRAFSRRAYARFLEHYAAHHASANGVRASYRVLSFWGQVG